MTEFQSKWLMFSSETSSNQTCKTCKRSPEHSGMSKDRTCKTCKSTSDGSAGSQVGHSAKKRWRALTPTEQQAEAAKYPSRGWLLIWSEHLQEVVVLVRDEQAAADAPAGYVTYTEAEIEHLRDITPDALRQVHEAKKFWSGRITSKEAGRA